MKTGAKEHAKLVVKEGLNVVLHLAIILVVLVVALLLPNHRVVRVVMVTATHHVQAIVALIVLDVRQAVQEDVHQAVLDAEIVVTMAVLKLAPQVVAIDALLQVIKIGYVFFML